MKTNLFVDKILSKFIDKDGKITYAKRLTRADVN